MCCTVEVGDVDGRVGDGVNGSVYDSVGGSVGSGVGGGVTRRWRCYAMNFINRSQSKGSTKNNVTCKKEKLNFSIQPSL